MINVTFQPAGTTVSVPAGSPLSEAAALAGIPVEMPCGGKGVCGKCLVRILSGEVVFDEKWLIGQKLASQGYVMICTATLKEQDVSVQTFSNLGKEKGKFADNLDDYARIDPALFPEAADGKSDFLVQPVSFYVSEPKPDDGLSDLDRFTAAAKQALGIDDISILFLFWQNCRIFCVPEIVIQIPWIYRRIYRIHQNQQLQW